MTVSEMNREFELLYDNASMSSRGLNIYEKSVLLTQAQDEIVKNIYSPYNPIQQGFEMSEKRRIELKELVAPYSASPYTPFAQDLDSVDLRLSENSIYFKVPEDIYYILQEQVIFSGINCKKHAMVIPTKYDEFNIQVNSPFRKPNSRKVWRFDRMKIGTISIVEIISVIPIETYKMVYLKKPKPIIIDNFEDDPELEGMGLTVEGRNVKTECELNSEIHRDILKRAVELAIKNSRENTLQANVELNNRNV